jgi:hypothetical protein
VWRLIDIGSVRSVKSPAMVKRRRKPAKARLDPLLTKGAPALWVYEERAGLAIYVSAAAFPATGTWAFKHVGTLKWPTVRAALKRRDTARGPGRRPIQ